MSPQQRARFLSGLVLFIGGYGIFVIGSVSTQFVLSPDVTDMLTLYGTRWLQPVYMMLIATGYTVGLVWGAYRMAVPGVHFLVANVQRWRRLGSGTTPLENRAVEQSSEYSST